jgi:septum formation protein
MKLDASWLYLASNSLRRRQLLRQLGVSFRVLVVQVDEAVHGGEDAQDYVARLALAKAQAGLRQLPADGVDIVLGADTCVALDGRIYGKPADRDEAVRMLGELSGHTHCVLSAVVLLAGGRILSGLSRSEVTFRVIGPAEAGRYWDTGEPGDKAGGYAIQGFGASFVENLRGSYSGVMGLPLFETARLCTAAGVPQWVSR